MRPPLPLLPRRGLTFALLFLILLFSHLASVNRMVTNDSRWTFHTAMSILVEGNTDLDEYGTLVARHGDYTVIHQNGHVYSMFPIGASLVAMPATAVLDAGCRVFCGYSYEEQLRRTIPYREEETVACLLVAMTGVIVFLIAEQEGGSAGRALLVTAVFAFGSAGLSTLSRAMWSNTSTVFLLTLALWLLLRRPERAWATAAAGVPLALAYICRPTSAIPAAVLGMYVLVRYPRRAVFTAVAGGLVLLAFVEYSRRTYGSVVPPYYQPQRLEGGHFAEALAGNLVSPSRGLLVFSPVFLILIPGSVLAWRQGRLKQIHGACALIVILHWVAVSSFGHWWGGHCYGPRLMSDVLPFLLVLLTAALTAMRHLAGWQLSTARVSWGVLMALSVVINLIGANSRGALQWNYSPTDVDMCPSRLWDWRDPQFMRLEEIKRPARIRAG